MHPGMKRIFCLLTTNDLGRFAPSALPHDKHIWALLCRNRRQKLSIPLRWQKIRVIIGIFPAVKLPPWWAVHRQTDGQTDGQTN